MIRIEGKHNAATVMFDSIDEATRAQIRSFVDCAAFSSGQIVVMPDCHAGKGSVIGLTIRGLEVLVPNIVGVDIGCGIVAARLPEGSSVDGPELDRFVRSEIPSGFAVNARVARDLNPELRERTEAAARAGGEDPERALRSIGSLGGGNHFIEADLDGEGRLWLVVHTGSRHLGLAIAETYQGKARAYVGGAKISVPPGLEYLPADHPEAKAYLEAMAAAQAYAQANRAEILRRLLDFIAPPGRPELVESVHNYIDFSDGVLRKGAIAARKDQRCVIPLNMRDGTLVCRGRGNPDFNLSAPHGAGRLMSRSEARRRLSPDVLRAEMRKAGIYTSTAGEQTIDEAPEAYKDTAAILAAIVDTVEVEIRLRPLYNFKAADDGPRRRRRR
jgi:tRNA-splicing ligase RtcB